MLIRQVPLKSWKALARCSAPLSLPCQISGLHVEADAGSGDDKPLHRYPERYYKLPPWIKIPPIGRNPDILKEIDAAASAFKKKNDVKEMEALFEKMVRPFVASHCILTCEQMGGPMIKQLHFMNKPLLGNFPLYVTSLTLMRALVKQREEKWIPIMKSLALNRVVVLMDWTHAFTNIEVLFYDHGLALSSELGPDAITYKAECDASYHDPKAPGNAASRAAAEAPPPAAAPPPTAAATTSNSVKEMGTGTTASVIWRGRQMIDRQITCRLPCRDSGHAEAIAVLSVLKRGRNLFEEVNGIKKHMIELIDVVMDNEANYNVLVGKHDLWTAKNSDVLMACIDVAKEYKTCRFRREPRQLLSLVDAMAHSTNGDDISDTAGLEENLGITPACLWGLPVIRINQSESKIIKLLGEDKVPDVDMEKVQAKSYYINVQDQDLKREALKGLIAVLDPSLVLVLVGSDESASQVLSELQMKYAKVVLCESSQVGVDSITIPKAAVVLISHSKVPQ